MYFYLFIFFYFFYFYSNLFCRAQGLNLRLIWPILRHEFKPKQPSSFKPIKHQLLGPVQACFQLAPTRGPRTPAACLLFSHTSKPFPNCQPTFYCSCVVLPFFLACIQTQQPILLHAYVQDKVHNFLPHTKTRQLPSSRSCFLRFLLPTHTTSPMLLHASFYRHQTNGYAYMHLT